MNFLIFIIISIAYLYFLLKIYLKTKSYKELRISFVLFILQLLSYIGNFMAGATIKFYSYNNFIQFSGMLISDIVQNCFVIAGLIMVIIKYKSPDQN